MFTTMTTKAFVKAQMMVQGLKENENGVTAIEYAIIGVAMASALFFIFSDGNFLSTLRNAWGVMANRIMGAANILG
ncbi:Flp family type IVb pilin [Dryocola clanedunensis]